VQLARLLIEDREPLLEVIWEKKALDLGAGRAEAVHEDDLIVRTAQDREISLQLTLANCLAAQPATEASALCFLCPLCAPRRYPSLS
jgi:hypothetical protein